MPLSRHLLLRAAPIALLSLIVATLFALATAAGDIRNERRGADATARMFRHLAGLQAHHAEARDGHLRALRDIAASGALRHLRLTLRDDRGVVLVPQAGTAAEAPAEPAASWTIPAAEGAAYRVALDWNPRSEESEALNALRRPARDVDAVQRAAVRRHRLGDPTGPGPAARDARGNPPIRARRVRCGAAGDPDRRARCHPPGVAAARRGAGAGGGFPPRAEPAAARCAGARAGAHRARTAR
ncbi:hypothetical protein OJJOAM_000273 [Cupriavidus sp. H18C1]|uniref:hypothetical protein n=1 Tax=Cupriavidus sp. H18C1 TaxID=3241601 RepID=UPI003BB98F67